MKAPLPKTTYVIKRTYFLFALLLLASLSLHAQQLAFPTAKGAGAYSVGGRGGQVIHVTTLDWDAPGGLKEAIQTTGPRIIVFDVSGVIDATSQAGFSDIINGSEYDNLTIAGQTAPNGGITVLTSEFRFRNVNNVIIRYIRFRRANSGLTGTYSQDVTWFIGNSNFIIDHCVFSHGNDEASSFASSSGFMDNITVQNCFFQDSKTGSIIGVNGQEGDFSFVNNVFSNISHRFPNHKGEGRADIVGNVVYNWKERLVRLGDNGTYNGDANLINNYYKGAANGLHQASWFPNYNISIARLYRLQVNNFSTGRIHSSGSYIVGQREIPQADDSDLWSIFAGSNLSGYSVGSPVPSSFFNNSPFELVGHVFPILPATEYFNQLVIEGDVGAYKTLNPDGTGNQYRDTYDTEHLNMIINDSYTGSFYDSRDDLTYPIIPENTRSIDFDTNNDGIPDVWKISKGFQPNDDLSAFVWPSGYVGIEEYLNEIDLNDVDIVDVTDVEVSPESATINIPETIQLSADVLPVDATYQSGTWSSSNNLIATVDSSGLVTPVSEGSCTITFTTTDGGFSDFTAITVTNFIIDLQSVIISPESATIELGESFQLNQEFIPQNATNTSGSWISSNPDIAVVNQNGSITAVSEGDTVITFTADDGGHSDTTEITVVDEFFGSYYLYNAATDIIIQEIVDDTSINIADYSNEINFRSIPEGGDDNPEVESVEVIWTGPTNGTWVESDPIYAGLPNGHVDLNFESYIVEEGTYNFTVNYYSGNSASGNIVAIDTFSITFFFSTLPVANAGPDQDICEGETITLTASGGPNFLWDTGEITASIEVSPTATTTYSVTVFDNDGNFDEDSVVVTVNAIPVAEAGDDNTICEGEIITLTASGGTSYLWSNGETTASIQVSPSIDTIYDVEVTTNNCSSTDSVTIFVNDAPDLTVSEDIVLVEGNSTILNVSGSDNYLWSTGETSSEITVAPLVTSSYSVTSIGPNGCSTTIDIIVTVIPEVVANAGPDETICSNDDIILTATGGSTYLWSTGETTAQIVVSPQQTTTYTVTVTDDYGFSDTDSVTVTVNETPSITVSEDVFMIEGESTTLSAFGGDNYLWSTGETSSSITVSPTDTTTYTVTSSGSTGCSATQQITVTVEPLFIAFAGEDRNVCENDTYEVELTANLGDSYLWSTGETTQSIVVSPLSTTTYTVTITSGFQEDIDDVTVYVDPNPNVVIMNGDHVNIMSGDFVTLSATGANSYEWNNGATQPNIAVSPSQTTTYEVRGYINDCYDEKQVIVNIIPEVEANAGEDVEICLGEIVTLTATGGDDYEWSTGESTQSIQVSPDTTTAYTVTVFNALDFDEDSVIVFVDDNCEDNTVEQPETPDSSGDFSFDVFPNPAVNQVNIRLSGSVALSRIYLYDITGKLMYSKIISNDDLSVSTIRTIDVSAFNPGMYYVKMVDVNREISKKLIIK